MRGRASALWAALALTTGTQALRYNASLLDYNLNQNETATNPVDYWGEWADHDFHPSPKNWRFPIYSFFVDRFANGDPTNDNANDTLFEHDLTQTQLRHGGDVQGIIDSLDYLQGMGIGGLYIAGSPFINLAWEYDSYSPTDFTLLDAHFGTIQAWRNMITEVHNRNMYVIMDNTMATMSDLLGFQGYLNTSTPFEVKEHPVQWKTDRQYLDFSIGDNNYNETCEYPRFYNETGYPVANGVTGLVGCYDSEFDQYGDVEAFGVFPDWMRELAKFASVQDRLREWVPSVREKIMRHSCIQIAMLDIDGFRFDKATQATVDALGDFGSYMRDCAASHNKQNFFMPGEITGGNTFGSIYLGRGRLADPAMQPANLTVAVQLTNDSSDDYYIREPGHQALDAAAFHYSTYRSLTRFLGMDGNLEAGYDAPVNWVNQWNTFLLTNDMVNPNPGGPGGFDPRHMYGVANQDVFRWSAITNGTQRLLLGLFVTTLIMPGIPLLLWGDEQAFYVLDNTASNYVFGRQAMTSNTAWQTHGCYSLNATAFTDFPLDTARQGCNDTLVGYDHRDPSHPIRNIIKSMYQMRNNYPALNDGWSLQQLSNQTHEIYYRGSGDVPTETGVWSVLRSRWEGLQDLSNEGGKGNQSVWLVYHNENQTVDYTFNCSDPSPSNVTTAFLAPFSTNVTVKNLFAPWDELSLIDGAIALGLEGSSDINGCLPNLTLTAYEFRAYVPAEQWVGPQPMLTRFVPGHDARIASTVPSGQQETIPIELHYSQALDCDSLKNSISFNSTTEDNSSPSIGTYSCGGSNDPPLSWIGAISSTFVFTAEVINVSNGIHEMIITRPSTSGGTNGTLDTIDHLFFRVGQVDNPMVFSAANYTKNLLHQAKNGSFYVSQKAAGADLWRYSMTWGSAWSNWTEYTGGNTTVIKQPWSGTKLQGWAGEHIMCQYWSRTVGSSDHIQQADLDSNTQPRRFPHLWFQGPYNQYGYDGGLDSEMRQDPADGRWKYTIMYEWPTLAQVNVWGINPDGQPDQTGVLGDIDGDSILDRLPPSSLSSVILNITKGPDKPWLAWQYSIDDSDNSFIAFPVGNRLVQMAIFCLLWLIPVLTGAFGIYVFMKSFYKVKFNQVGISEKTNIIPLALRRKLKNLRHHDEGETNNPLMKFKNKATMMQSKTALASGIGGKRRMVLIATMEYDIEDWAIKIKIGGLGVMAQLMGKNLGHQDLIWVVPCVGGVDYPIDQRVEPMSVQILGNPYEVQVQYHVLRNITYVLLDAPVFRQQSKAEPYPPRMDDLDSAVYYSAWNQCIALTIKRFNPDLYHINDYHGAVAPIHLLPDTIPACLSLHNAEFQGLWPMRTEKEREEVCQVYNMSVEVAQKYVQFGEVFNLLHAGASYLRIHQQGFGAVGVSKKYGKRSYARYPIFWGLKKVGKLPNPDPSDTGEWDKQLPKDEDIKVDPVFEQKRGELKRQAQEWAGLNQDPQAELFVFVGRWSMQKGVDLIADVFPAVLEAYPHVQLVCVGPVIDLYGKFAALKLGKMMELYPGRVFSKPEFTALPPYIFSGAEFALIPSRDEPFGLVAVEFGRKGALGVGARVGGLGQMPGWWYTVESTTTTHLIHQFKQAIDGALSSKPETRAMMRARSAKQRFPVAQWVEDLEILQSTAIKIHDREAKKALTHSDHPASPRHPGLQSPSVTTFGNNSISQANSSTNLAMLGNHSRAPSYGNLNRLSTWGKPRPDSWYGDRPRSPSREREEIPQAAPTTTIKRTLSLGVKSGPGHLNVPNEGRGRRRMRKRETSPNPSGRSDSPDDQYGQAITDIDEEDDDIIGMYGDQEYTVTQEEAEAMQRRDRTSEQGVLLQPRLPQLNEDFLSPRKSSFGTGNGTPRHSHFVPPESPGLNSAPGTPGHEVSDTLLPPMAAFARNDSEKRLSSTSVLSLDSVVGDKKDFKLQKVDPFFTDQNGEFYKNFEAKLGHLDGKNSEGAMCIEDFLVKSEKKWFDKFRDARLGRTPAHSRANSPAPSLFFGSNKRAPSPTGSIFNENLDVSDGTSSGKEADQFLLGEDYVPPTGLKKWMQLRFGDWPVYSLFLAFGQIIAANSYQITLLTGTVGQTAEKLYIIATIYLITSGLWWVMFRSFRSLYSLSLPFFFYGIAFLLIGMAHFVNDAGTKGWVQNIATGIYAIASSSGSIYFALNFGDEGGAPVKAWVYRACVVQGTQQAYVVALWYWGSVLVKGQTAGITQSGGIVNSSSIANSIAIFYICIPIAVLMWTCGILVFFGLPNYYRQTPGAVPSFYSSLFRRKIILWFFVAICIQNYFLSAPYGRNWAYLWSSTHAQAWQIVCLCVLFFIGVWAIFLWIFGVLSKDHSWILPVFAIGLGAPRWCQMLWGVSGMGQYVPWAGGPVASALVGRSLWLWLGVLDSLQGVGFGMILLQTLTRIHIAFTLLAAQVLGSVATILARATAPDKIGPGPIFPNFALGGGGLGNAWFWIGLSLQLVICAGFFTFFRKEQLSKP
ncbi:Cell wall alpha-1,3-glucan synthase ags1 [Agyrium rufum]|nr:Cell wall alpha-1,3-glucan synthase ags1 [Agyrium rufum]